jgi:hypothetical protein
VEAILDVWMQICVMEAEALVELFDADVARIWIA